MWIFPPAGDVRSTLATSPNPFGRWTTQSSSEISFPWTKAINPRNKIMTISAGKIPISVATLFPIFPTSLSSIILTSRFANSIQPRIFAAPCLGLWRLSIVENPKSARRRAFASAFPGIEPSLPNSCQGAWPTILDFGPCIFRSPQKDPPSRRRRQRTSAREQDECFCHLRWASVYESRPGSTTDFPMRPHVFAKAPPSSIFRSIE